MSPIISIANETLLEIIFYIYFYCLSPCTKAYPLQRDEFLSILYTDENKYLTYHRCLTNIYWKNKIILHMKGWGFSFKASPPTSCKIPLSNQTFLSLRALQERGRETPFSHELSRFPLSRLLAAERLELRAYHRAPSCYPPPTPLNSGQHSPTGEHNLSSRVERDQTPSPHHFTDVDFGPSDVAWSSQGYTMSSWVLLSSLLIHRALIAKWPMVQRLEKCWR